MAKITIAIETTCDVCGKRIGLTWENEAGINQKWFFYKLRNQEHWSVSGSNKLGWKVTCLECRTRKGKGGAGSCD